MRFLIQRVEEASVSVEGHIIGKINRGFLVFIGISAGDFTDGSQDPNPDFAKLIADKMVKKLIGLRIFQDENGKTNLDLKSVGGELLIISQFTLCADCRKGNRPSFTSAAPPDAANMLYEYIIKKCREEVSVVESGSFGAAMKVTLVNAGPFTVLLDSDEICATSHKPSE